MSTHVAILRWPEDAETVDQLRLTGAPRLLLVAPGVDAPACTECGEDWIRLPATDEDLRVRAATVAARAARHVAHPEVTPDGRIVFGDHWAPLSTIEGSLAAVLCDNFGSVVSHSSLDEGCGGRSLSPNAIRVHMMRLRKRIAPVGLAVRTVHGRGYLLELAA
jgi:DNA-binding response OmpR family regulator